MKNVKNIVILINILTVNILFSQTVFSVDIKKKHKYDVYSNESLHLILDKTDSTFTFLSLPPLNDGDIKQDAISEGKYHITKRCLTLTSINQSKFNSDLFDDLTGLRFKIRKEKLIPKSDKYKYHPYVKELIKSDLKEIEYPLNYIN